MFNKAILINIFDLYASDTTKLFYWTAYTKTVINHARAILSVRIVIFSSAQVQKRFYSVPLIFSNNYSICAAGFRCKSGIISNDTLYCGYSVKWFFSLSSTRRFRIVKYRRKTDSGHRYLVYPNI